MGKQILNKKVVFLPLDERPCNYKFPFDIFKNTNLNVVRINKDLMGYKKSPAKFDVIKKFLLEESNDADALVIAVDTLLYGGIIPSRLHSYTEDDLSQRLDVLKQVKTINPKIKIYAFHLIMRTPQYNSSDEEPDYYEYVGKDIFKLGYFNHKKTLNIINEEELEILRNINVKEEYLKDFLSRRKTNLALTKKSVEFVKEKVIDFLIIPQDDSSEFGYTALDQEEIRKDIKNYNLNHLVYMYPGADEVANILLSRVLNETLNQTPKIYIKYNSISAPWTIPSLEDRMLDTTIKYQILATGSIPASSMSEADITLYVNAPSDQMITAPYQYELKGRGFTVLRNMIEFIENIKYCINVLKKPAIIADLAFGNGGDVELGKILNEEDLLMKVASYSGWNTSSNALGTALAQGIVYKYNGRTKEHLNFLALRYVEDLGYCATVRRQVTERYLEPNKFTYFDVKEKNGVIAEKVKELLNEFIINNLNTVSDKIKLKNVSMPWQRMYEVDIDLKYEEKE